MRRHLWNRDRRGNKLLSVEAALDQLLAQLEGAENRRWEMKVDCIFCKIVAGEIPANVVYRDERVTAFRDVKPQAPIHVLIIPNEHIRGVGDMEASQASAMGDLAVAAKVIAAQEGIAESGFRLVLNSGPDANQTVDHLHMHLIGGRMMAWPPG